MAQENNNNGLLDFNWDNDTDTSFFNLNKEGEDIKEPAKPKATPAKPKQEDTNDSDDTDTKPKGEEDTDDEDVDNNFFDTDDDSDDEGTDDDKPKGSNTGSIYEDLYKDLKEEGIFKHINLEEGEEIDADRFFELQQEEIEAEVALRLENWAKEDLDEDAKAFIQFKLKGGSTADFLDSYGRANEITLGDITNEDYQDQLIRHQLQKEGWDREEIEDRLEYLTESDKKAKFAEKYHKKLEEQIEQEKQELLQQTELQKQRVKEQETNFKNSIKKTLDESDDLKGIKFSADDKNTIINFLTKKDQKIDGNRTITGFQKTLSEAFNDPQKVVLIAKILKDDFDFSSIEKSAVTKKTKQVRKNIEQRQSMRPYGSGSSLQGKDLASFFEK